MGRYCVVGAGAAGLSAVRELAEAGHEVACFEKSDRVGGHWNTDYDALHLITSRNQTHFRDFPMPARYPHFPSRDQVRDYIAAFAAEFRLDRHIVFGAEVLQVGPVPEAPGRPVGSAGWAVRTSRGDEGEFDGVLVANGHLWNPHVPEISEDFMGRQVHTSRYRNVDDLEGARVLVVGAGNSGCDMAVDVAQSRIAVDIVVRKGIHFQPKMYFGIPRAEVPFLAQFSPDEQDLVNRLLARVAIGENSAYPGLPEPESRTLAGGATTVNDLLLYWIQHGRIGVRPGIVSCAGTTVRFIDGTEAEYDSIIWATGYTTALPFLTDDLIAWQNGNPVRHAGGILPVGPEQLYFVGLIAPRGPQIPVYGEQMQLILRMIALHEKQADEAPALSAFFARVQEPELHIDVVRDRWNTQMADTAAHLTGLENIDALNGVRQ